MTKRTFREKMKHLIFSINKMGLVVILFLFSFTAICSGESVSTDKQSPEQREQDPINGGQEKGQFKYNFLAGGGWAFDGTGFRGTALINFRLFPESQKSGLSVFQGGFLENLKGRLGFAIGTNFTGGSQQGTTQSDQMFHFGFTEEFVNGVYLLSGMAISTNGKTTGFFGLTIDQDIITAIFKERH